MRCLATLLLAVSIAHLAHLKHARRILAAHEAATGNYLGDPLSPQPVNQQTGAAASWQSQSTHYPPRITGQPPHDKNGWRRKIWRKLFHRPPAAKQWQPPAEEGTEKDSEEKKEEPAAETEAAETETVKEEEKEEAKEEEEPTAETEPVKEEEKKEVKEEQVQEEKEEVKEEEDKEEDEEAEEDEEVGGMRGGAEDREEEEAEEDETEEAEEDEKKEPESEEPQMEVDNEVYSWLVKSAVLAEEGEQEEPESEQPEEPQMEVDNVEFAADNKKLSDAIAAKAKLDQWSDQMPLRANVAWRQDVQRAKANAQKAIDAAEKPVNKARKVSDAISAENKKVSDAIAAKAELDQAESVLVAAEATFDAVMQVAETAKADAEKARRVWWRYKVAYKELGDRSKEAKTTSQEALFNWHYKFGWHSMVPGMFTYWLASNDPINGPPGKQWFPVA